MTIRESIVFFVVVSILWQGQGLSSDLAPKGQPDRGVKTAAPQARAVRGVKAARLGTEVVVQAAGRRKPYCILGDGHELVANYVDQADQGIESLPEAAEPKGLASGDFDEDGIQDLVTAYATKTGGVISIYRGNVDAVYPNSPIARAHKAAGTFLDSPFLSPAKVVETFATPDFITVGDFDADGHLDVVTAQRGSNTLIFLHGDGNGGVGQAEAFGLPGEITAIAAGDTNRADGLSHLVVTVQAAAGARLLVYEGVYGALRSLPEEIPLPRAASAVVVGYLNEDDAGDIAVAAGNEVVTVYGRDRKLSLDARAQTAVTPPTVRRHLLPSNVTSLAIGDFTGDMTLELGAATEDGSVFLISDDAVGNAALSAKQGKEAKGVEWLARRKGAGGAQLIGSNFSGLNHDILLMADGANQRIYLWADDNERRERGDLELTSSPGVREEPSILETRGEVMAVLPMRLNRDGLSDLVILRKGHSEPVILTTLISGFTVCNNSDCGGSGCGSLRDLINTVNSQPVGGSYAIDFDSQAFQGVPTVQISNSLPAINRATVIDGAATGNCGATLQSDDVSAQALNGVQIMSNNSSNAFRLTNSSCIIQNFVINRINNGITLDSNTSNNQVLGNKIGTNINGNGTLPNSGRGVFINNARNNLIGGNPNAGGVNTISGNAVGIDINAGSDNQVRFNNIGTDAGVNTTLGNSLNVRITNGSARNRIGASLASSFDNAIWGSGGAGVLIDSSSGNLLQSNWVRSSQAAGIEIRSSSGNTVGGTVSTTQSRTINFIWSNGGDGVNINGAAATNNLVQSNNLGVNFDNAGTPVDVHNNGHGVLITAGASGNLIGSANAGLGNFIAYNLLNGVTVISGTGNLIASNRIFNNTLLGIDLGNDGPDTNDPLDADSGPNGRQNFPTLTSAIVPPALAPDEVAIQAVATISGTLTSEPNTAYTLECYYGSQACSGSGHQTSGSIPTKLLLADGSEPTVTTDGNGVANFSFQFTLPNNATTGFINATARKNSTGDTSEFSLCQQVGAQACNYVLNPTSASVGSASGTGSFAVSVANGCTWTAISSDTSWLTTSSSGNGNGTVSYAFTQNSNSAQRSATIAVGGQPYTVTQAGASSILITTVQKEGKHFIVTGSGFVAGSSTLLVNGEEKKTRVDSPTSIFSKKGAKGVALPARLQVRNSDGSVSNEFTFQ